MRTHLPLSALGSADARASFWATWHRPAQPDGGRISAEAAVGVFVARLGPEKFVMWSNTVDAPVSPVLSRPVLLSELQSEYELPADEALRTIDRAEANGTSYEGLGLEAVLEENRAGSDEEHLNLDEIIERYTRD